MLNNGNPLISVIVPVYNTEKYIARCIDSILGQSYENIEIIIVDDGSTDKSRSVCEAYTEKYKNIQVYHQENKGQAVARNYGLEKCTGKYIGFIDSDDYIAFDMYEYLYNLIDKYKADCASIQFKFTEKDTEKINNKNEQINIYEGEKILEQHLLEAMNTGSHSVCRCLFDCNTIKQVRFPVGIINEDIPFKFAALSNVQRMVDSNLIKYYYYQKGESTTRGAFKERDLNLFKATELLKILAKPYNEKIRRLAKAKHERGYFSILARIAFYGCNISKERKKEIVEMCQVSLRRKFIFLLKMPLPFSRKVLIMLFIINYSITEVIIRITKKLLSV